MGTVKAARDGGRVRVQTEDGKLFWHDTANLVPLGLGPASPTDFATGVPRAQRFFSKAFIASACLVAFFPPGQRTSRILKI